MAPKPNKRCLGSPRSFMENIKFSFKFTLGHQSLKQIRLSNGKNKELL